MSPRREKESPLFGRSVEIERIRSVLRRVSEGSGAALFLSGEAGIGKTRLLTEASRLAAEEDFVIISGGAFELGRDQAFSLIVDVLRLTKRSSDPHAAAIGRLLTDVRADPREVLGFGAWTSLEFRIVDEIVDHVEQSTASGPVLMLLDDLQWADGASLRVIGTLRRRLSATALCIMCASRPTPRNPDLEALAGDGTDDQVLSLDALDFESVSSLAQFHLGDRRDVRTTGEIARAGGNPLLVVELASRLHTTGDAAEPDSSSDREFLRTLLRSRARGLSPGATEMLRLSSVFGSVVSTSEIALITGNSIAELVGFIDEALADGVLVERGDRLAFRHDLIREAFYLDMPEDVRKALHLTAGRALAQSGSAPLQAAVHMAAGAVPGDREAFESVYQAARDTLRSSPQVAVQLLRRARELLTVGDPSAQAVEAALAIALTWSGRPREAAETAEQVLSRAAPPDAAVLARTALWNALVMAGRFFEARNLMAEAGDRVPPGGRERATQMAFDALTRLFVGEFEGSESKALEALALAREDGSTWGESVALICLAWTESTKGRFDRGFELSTEAVSIVDHHPFADILHGLILVDGGRFDEAERVYNAGLRAAEETGQALLVPLFHWALMGLRYFTADWDDSIAEAETGLALADELGVALAILMPFATLSHIAMHRGDLEEARRLVERGEKQVSEAGPNLGVDRLIGMRAAVAGFEADFDISVQPVSEVAWQAIKIAGAAIGAVVSTAPELIRGTLLALSRAAPDHPGRDRARGFVEQVVTDVEGIAGGADIPPLKATALICRALATQNATDALAAVELLRKTPYIFHGALACEDAAVLVAARGELDEARTLFEEALAVYERCGAVWDIARATASMRGLGIRRGARVSRKRPAVGWDSLTPTERTVAGLVAEGLTNRQVGERLFLSRHTVDTHLRHIYAKLGLASRVELAAAQSAASR